MHVHLLTSHACVITDITYISGKGKEFFNLGEYKNYKRIVFFLCDATDFNLYEEMQKKIENNEDDSSSEVDHEFDDFVNIDHDQQISDDGISTEVVEKILQVDIETAIKNEDSKDEDKDTTIDLTAKQSPQQLPSVSQCPTKLVVTSHVDVIKKLASKLNRYEQFFLVARRNAPLPRILKLWQRQASKSNVTNLLRVHYSGEDGIDSGAIALEFLEKVIQDMAVKV